MSNNKQIEKKLKLPHRETVISINTIQTNPFDNQKIEIMSNNKQSMKLYTEEQVIDIFEKYGNMSAINARNILDLSESIQLPSDEEIEEMGKDIIVYNNTKRGWFIEGLKFMRDKIQEQ